MIKRYFNHSLYALFVVLGVTGAPARATAPVPVVYARLWASAAAAWGNALYLEHPVYILLREGDKVRATVLGDYQPRSTMPPGVDVIVARPGWIEVWCTRAGLAALADDSRTLAIHPPFRFVPDLVVTEAAGIMSAGAYHAAGVGGAGVRVAVIDVDFTGHEALLGTELPARVFARSFVDPQLEPYRDRSSHGTAVAELIHDVAPEADLIFLTILEQKDFPNAVSWCIDNDVDIVSMSLGFLAGPRDGTSVISGEVDRAAEAGIVWVNSAGNAAASHWGGDWGDSDSDSYLEFAPGLETIGFTYDGNQGGTAGLLIAHLIWDRWPISTGPGLDLEIYRDSLRTLFLASSAGQPSVTLPYRLATLDNPVAGTRYYLAVKRQAGMIAEPLRLDIFNDEAAVDMQPRDSFGSMLIPADARGAIAVGAYDYSVTSPGADPVRFYSSRGPTWDGRIKPEIVAADGVSTVTYGDRIFYGTSASAPHVAGAAALLSSAAVTGGLFTYVWNASDLLDLLAVRSIDFGPPGVDSTYGLGAIVLPPATSRPEDFTAAAFPNPFNPDLVIAFNAEASEEYTLRVFDVLGRKVWQTRGMRTAPGEVRITWTGCEGGGRALGSGVYLFRIETSAGRDFTGRALLLK